MRRYRSSLAVAVGVAGLASASAAQTTTSERLDFDETIVHTDPVGMNFSGVPVAPSRIVSATLAIRLNQSSIPDELQVFDTPSQAWITTNSLGGSGWQVYLAPLDGAYFGEVAAGLQARLVVNFISSFQGSLIDYAELSVTYDACVADLDDNGFVNGDDYDLFASAFDAADSVADLDANGFVNGDDYDLFASAFESGC
ncbi:MAG: hypothetical protein U0638_13010 [Phycisphaerales bacterium]